MRAFTRPEEVINQGLRLFAMYTEWCCEPPLVRQDIGNIINETPNNPSQKDH
jgi:hypothetical protein